MAKTRISRDETRQLRPDQKKASGRRQRRAEQSTLHLAIEHG